MSWESAPKPIKPLGSKAYGSIGHLPKSRLGPGDWHVHAGQARICLEKPRKGDRVIVVEKVDGACMVVANIDGALVPLTRAGYRAQDGTFPHLRLFADYVEREKDRFQRLLCPGERVVGEWLALAHGTRYNVFHPFFSPFMAFDVFRNGKRVLRDEFRRRIKDASIAEPIVISGGPACSIEAVEGFLGSNGFSGALDHAEGAVWRVEREGRVDFLAKYVRPVKVDGRYLPEVSGAAPIWHWQPTLSSPSPSEAKEKAA